MTDEAPSADFEAPFEPQAADLGGCGKPAVIGCLALLLILAAALVIFLFKARSMLDWALVRYQQVIVESLSDEVTDDERRRLDSAFDSAREAIRDNRMDPEALQRLQRIMSTPPRASRKIGPETVRELTEALEAIAKVRLELPRPEPAAAPEPGMTALLHHAAI